MLSSTSIIITIIISIASIGIGYVLFYFLYKKNNKQFVRKQLKAQQKQIEEIDYLKKEIKRLKYINTKKEKTASSQVQNKVNEVANNGFDNEYPTKVISDKEIFEKEKTKFREKNKKLWEQSISIHKEKERINILKIEIEKQHDEVTGSIRYAKRIQNALIPAENILKRYLSDFFVLWKPRDIVSGDFYWAKSHGSKIIFVVADSTGHGVPGAFMSVLGIAFLNEIVSKNDSLKANDILEKLRVLVKKSLNQSLNSNEPRDGMDMALCIIDKEAQKIEYAGAYNSLIIIRNKTLTEYKATRNPVGIYLKEKPFANNIIDIQPNDYLYMFTDGFKDQFGGKYGRIFSSKRFKELLLKSYNNSQNLSEQKSFLQTELSDWMGNYNQIDDILVAGFKI